jgi:hypothetical protein
VDLNVAAQTFETTHVTSAQLQAATGDVMKTIDAIFPSDLTADSYWVFGSGRLGLMIGKPGTQNFSISLVPMAADPFLNVRVATEQNGILWLGTDRGLISVLPPSIHIQSAN